VIAMRVARDLSSSTETSAKPKRLLAYLPAIYRERYEQESEATPTNYLASFLRAFEHLLFGETVERTGEQDEVLLQRLVWDNPEAGLEEKIVELPSLLDPLLTSEDFLPWLASWAALDFHPAISMARKRRLLSEIVPLYRIRGTRLYMERILSLCVDATVLVSDTEVSGFVVGSLSVVGSSTYIGGAPPHFFLVRLAAPKLSQADSEIQLDIARKVIDLAKPAHTLYELLLVSPQMEVGRHSTVGLDTVLGSSVAQA
jgi:phage tail-like protein